MKLVITDHFIVH